MSILLTLRNKNSWLLLLPFILSFFSANLYSAPFSIARSITPADTRGTTTPAVISSNPAIATASIKGTTVIPGNHTLSITALAQAEQLTTANTKPNLIDALNITEALTISAGGSQIIVHIEATDSLTEIANKINSAAITSNLHTIAVIIETQPKHYRLVIASTLTGLTNAISISESGAGSNILGISVELTKASNATFKFDQLDYIVNSNNIIIGEWLIINLINLGQVILAVENNT